MKIPTDLDPKLPLRRILAQTPPLKEFLDPPLLYIIFAWHKGLLYAYSAERCIRYIISEIWGGGGCSHITKLTWEWGGLSTWVRYEYLLCGPELKHVSRGNEAVCTRVVRTGGGGGGVRWQRPLPGGRRDRASLRWPLRYFRPTPDPPPPPHTPTPRPNVQKLVYSSHTRASDACLMKTALQLTRAEKYSEILGNLLLDLSQTSINPQGYRSGACTASTKERKRERQREERREKVRNLGV